MKYWINDKRKKEAQTPNYESNKREVIGYRHGVGGIEKVRERRAQTRENMENRRLYFSRKKQEEILERRKTEEE